jgi:Lipase (class 3)
MKNLFHAFVVAVLAASPKAARAEPNFDRAYVLAAASYCAYAVSEADADSGLKRAVECLNRAASDGLLNELNVDPENVEAFVGPDPKDAYLLINGKKGIILAFRGTIVPPVDLTARGPGGAVAGALLKDPSQATKGLKTFVSDWLNNAVVKVTDHQHHGYLGSWTALKANLDKDGSKLNSFLANPASGGAPAVFVTGHSKGGALATLAVRNLPNSLKHTSLTVYTFAAAKSLDTEGAKTASAQEQAIWRFEKDGDVVPSLPVDKSVAGLFPITIFPAYAHVGRRVVFLENEDHTVSEPVNGLDSPDDLTRLKATLVEVFGDWVSGVMTGKGDDVITNWMMANESACRRIVDRHFEVFSSVLIRANAHRAELGTNFFSAGFYDGDRQILWGYRKWCDLLKPHQ